MVVIERLQTAPIWHSGVLLGAEPEAAVRDASYSEYESWNSAMFGAPNGCSSNVLSQLH